LRLPRALLVLKYSRLSEKDDDPPAVRITTWVSSDLR
jgi:hypothetical protein